MHYEINQFARFAADITPVEPLVDVGEVKAEEIDWLLYDLGNDLHFILCPVDHQTGKIVPFDERPFPTFVFSNLFSGGVELHEPLRPLSPKDKPVLITLAGQQFKVTPNSSNEMTLMGLPAVRSTGEQDKVLYGLE